MIYLLRKKATYFSLQSKTSEFKKLWAQGLKPQWLDFKVYINLEDDKEVARILLIEKSKKAFIFLNFLNNQKVTL